MKTILPSLRYSWVCPRAAWDSWGTRGEGLQFPGCDHKWAACAPLLHFLPGSEQPDWHEVTLDGSHAGKVKERRNLSLSFHAAFYQPCAIDLWAFKGKWNFCLVWITAIWRFLSHVTKSCTSPRMLCCRECSGPLWEPRWDLRFTSRSGSTGHWVGTCPVFLECCQISDQSGCTSVSLLVSARRFQFLLQHLI